jgi:Transposase IS66 family
MWRRQVGRQAKGRRSVRDYCAVASISELRDQGNGEWQSLDRRERFARIVAQRQARSLPVLKRFGEWLDAEAPRVLPKTPPREALEYTRNHWAALNRYAQHGHLAIDNNAAERALRGAPSDLISAPGSREEYR